MYYADSDFLTIILAMITIAAGVYSSVKKKKTPSGKGKVEKVTLTEDMLEVSESNKDEIEDEEDLLDILFGLKKEKAETDEVVEQPVMEEVDVEGERAVFAEQAQGTDEVAAIAVGSVDDGLEQTVDAGDAIEELGDGKKLSGLKEKVKKSPKDMVLFAEILKPKFKEF